MSRVGIFYGPPKGNVSKVAGLIARSFGDRAEMRLIKEVKPSDFDSFDHLIFGLSTIGKANWDSTHTDNDWDLFMSHINQVNWLGKTVAIFGLGDQVAYPDNFVDAIGWLFEKLEPYRIKIVGQVDTDGYRFEKSGAVRGNQFIGLPLDEDNEPELTQQRIDRWIECLKKSGF